MANPNFPVNTAGGQWTLVATGVTYGTIYKMLQGTYLHTRRDSGEAAPTLRSEGVKAFINVPDSEPIGHPDPSDIYIWSDSDGILKVDAV